MTPDREKLKTLLTETITLLCKNGLDFQSEFSIEALIGITLDQNDVFLVSIKETVRSLQSDDEEEDVQIEFTSSRKKRSSSDTHNVSDVENQSHSSVSAQSGGDVQKNVSNFEPEYLENGRRPSFLRGLKRKSRMNPVQKISVSSPKSKGGSTPEMTGNLTSLENEKCENLISNEPPKQRNSNALDDAVIQNHEPERKRRRIGHHSPHSRTFDASNESELTSADDFLAQCKSEPLDVIELDESLMGGEDAEMACKNEMSDFMYNSICSGNNDSNQRTVSGSNAWYGQNNASSSSATLGCSSWQNEPTFDQNNQIQDQVRLESEFCGRDDL